MAFEVMNSFYSFATNDAIKNSIDKGVGDTMNSSVPYPEEKDMFGQKNEHGKAKKLFKKQKKGVINNLKPKLIKALEVMNTEDFINQVNDLKDLAELTKLSGQIKASEVMSTEDFTNQVNDGLEGLAKLTKLSEKDLDELANLSEEDLAELAKRSKQELQSIVKEQIKGTQFAAIYTITDDKCTKLSKGQSTEVKPDELLKVAQDVAILKILQKKDVILSSADILLLSQVKDQAAKTEMAVGFRAVAFTPFYLLSDKAYQQDFSQYLDGGSYKSRFFGFLVNVVLIFIPSLLYAIKHQNEINSLYDTQGGKIKTNFIGSISNASDGIFRESLLSIREDTSSPILSINSSEPSSTTSTASRTTRFSIGYELIQEGVKKVMPQDEQISTVLGHESFRLDKFENYNLRNLGNTANTKNLMKGNSIQWMHNDLKDAVLRMFSSADDAARNKLIEGINQLADPGKGYLSNIDLIKMASGSGGQDSDPSALIFLVLRNNVEKTLYAKAKEAIEAKPATYLDFGSYVIGAQRIFGSMNQDQQNQLIQDIKAQSLRSDESELVKALEALGLGAEKVKALRKKLESGSEVDKLIRNGSMSEDPAISSKESETYNSDTLISFSDFKLAATQDYNPFKVEGHGSMRVSRAQDTIVDRILREVTIKARGAEWSGADNDQQYGSGEMLTISKGDKSKNMTLGVLLQVLQDKAANRPPSDNRASRASLQLDDMINPEYMGEYPQPEELDGDVPASQEIYEAMGDGVNTPTNIDSVRFAMSEALKRDDQSGENDEIYMRMSSDGTNRSNVSGVVSYTDFGRVSTLDKVFTEVTSVISEHDYLDSDLEDYKLTFKNGATLTADEVVNLIDQNVGFSEILKKVAEKQTDVEQLKTELDQEREDQINKNKDLWSEIKSSVQKLAQSGGNRGVLYGDMLSYIAQKPRNKITRETRSESLFDDANNPLQQGQKLQDILDMLNKCTINLDHPILVSDFSKAFEGDASEIKSFKKSDLVAVVNAASGGIYEMTPLEPNKNVTAKQALHENQKAVTEGGNIELYKEVKGLVNTLYDNPGAMCDPSHRDRLRRRILSAITGEAQISILDGDRAFIEALTQKQENITPSEQNEVLTDVRKLLKACVDANKEPIYVNIQPENTQPKITVKDVVKVFNGGGYEPSSLNDDEFSSLMNRAEAMNGSNDNTPTG
ncbi:MAG: hypothetical protein VXW87_01550 [Pseudomonadota bacterium]|nr:hypothetical protein [Pseudomonadota bacterium]